MVLCDRNADAWVAVSAGQGKHPITTTVAVHLVDGADMFDTVNVGFDGTNFWFDRVDSRADSATKGRGFCQALSRVGAQRSRT